MAISIDLGCGMSPKNPFAADMVYGVDVFENAEKGIVKCDLFTKDIPFATEAADFISAFDFIEHVPRILYCPDLRFCFVELMNDIYRVLKPGGKFISFTPGYPAEAAFVDPTHVNFITLNTFPNYFGPRRLASMYGFKGNFVVERNEWHDWISPPLTLAPGVANPGPTHILTILQKV
jgi:SAM-dependent methyltransferase